MAETTSNPIGHFAFKDQTDASQQHTDAESKNFENLASKLVQVPKAEIDEKRAQK